MKTGDIITKTAMRYSGSLPDESDLYLTSQTSSRRILIMVKGIGGAGRIYTASATNKDKNGEVVSESGMAATE